MSGHTPGPWKVVLHGRAAYVSIYHPIGLPRETGWAEFSVQPYSEPTQAEANAHLIAAAPDLLAGALEAIAAWDMEEDTAEWNHEDRLEAAIAILRAAIAKATATT